MPDRVRSLPAYQGDLNRTAPVGATSPQCMAAFEVLFSVTVYRTGEIRIDGHGRREALPEILRIVASSIEAGVTILSEYDDD